MHQTRAVAVDGLHKALRGASDRARVLAGVPSFVPFIIGLVDDRNFKVAISAMQILSDLISITGRDIQSQIGWGTTPGQSAFGRGCVRPQDSLVVGKRRNIYICQLRLSAGSCIAWVLGLMS